jgi:hypothetical protein
MEHDLEQAANMKLLLCTFEQLSGLKINFHKKQDVLLWRGKRGQKPVYNFVLMWLRSIPIQIPWYSDAPQKDKQ